MWPIHKVAVGAILYIAAGAPLMAQQTTQAQVTPAQWEALRRQDSVNNVNLFRSYGLRQEYLGITFTEAQKAKFKELWQKYQEDAKQDEATHKGLARHEAMLKRSERYEGLRRAVLTPEQQKVLDRNAQLLPHLHEAVRLTLLAGIDLTDTQTDAVKKLLVEERTQSAALGASWNAIYALLTPEQQKVVTARLGEAGKATAQPTE